jgi:hypothetical protein
MKFSIKTLCPNIKIKNTEISTDNIGKSLNTNNEKLLEFTCKELIDENIEKRKKILNIYNKYYINCIQLIKQRNNENKTDLIYSIKNIPSINYDIKISLKDCMEYIEYKLKKNEFDIYKMNDLQIFITWRYIEFKDV